jgi:hypothetical protein
MCLLWSTNWGFISQKTIFFIVSAVKNIKSYNLNYTNSSEAMNFNILKNGVFWVVTPCGSCKNRRFGFNILSRTRTGYVNYNTGLGLALDVFAQDYGHNRSQSLGTPSHWNLLESVCELVLNCLLRRSFPRVLIPALTNGTHEALTGTERSSILIHNRN